MAKLRAAHAKIEQLEKGKQSTVADVEFVTPPDRTRRRHPSPPCSNEKESHPESRIADVNAKRDRPDAKKPRRTESQKPAEKPDADGYGAVDLDAEDDGSRQAEEHGSDAEAPGDMPSQPLPSGRNFTSGGLPSKGKGKGFGQGGLKPKITSAQDFLIILD